MGEFFNGRAPTPTEILNLRGSWRGKARKWQEPKPEQGKPRCPAWLSDKAKRHWKRIAPILESMGVLTKADTEALARYCVFIELWRQEVKQWEIRQSATYETKAGYQQHPVVRTITALSLELNRLEQFFGLTPSARARLSVSDEKTETHGDDKARFLNVG